MEYKLEKSSIVDKELIKKYKLANIIDYATNLSEEETKEIKEYVNDEVNKGINNYQLIIVDNKKVGCLLVENYEDGIMLDEIYLEKEYRNKGIGTNILKNVLKNDIVYLWVYKSNENAYNIYKKLGFKILQETENRYFMKYEKNI